MSSLLSARGLNAFRLAGHLREVRRIRRLALARRLLPPNPLEQLARSYTVSSMPAWTSPSSANRAGIVAIVKSSVASASSSSQRERRGDSRVDPSAHRVRGRDRAVARVLVVVDEDAPAALLFHHAVVTSFGARRSTSRANASAHRRTS